MRSPEAPQEGYYPPVERAPLDDVTDDELPSLSREDLVERARGLQIVLRVARAVSTSRDANDLARRFVDAVAAYTRFPSVCLFRYRPKEQVFQLVAEHGFTMENYPPPSSALPLVGSLTGLAATRGEIMTTGDIRSDDRIEPGTRAVLATAGYITASTVPILHRGEILGAFNLVYPGGAVLQPNERRMLEAIEKTIGLALAQQLADDRERELEAQARRAQQLDSLGVLAGGLAHDFNNLLVGIVGCLDLARHDVRKAGLASTEDTLDDALQAAGRATSLVRQLLTFSRGGAPSRKAVGDVGRVVSEAATFAARGTSVRCVIEVIEPLGVVECDPGQLGQVVQNLVLNACQASDRGATVTVRVTRTAAEAGSEPRLRIEVIDQGSGIAPAHLARIFEPFFTAREGGTGLGLSVSHSIVARHGGALTVDSKPGRGTTFVVDLPVGSGVLASPTSPPRVEGAFGGRALVMDDEPAVRRVAALMLEKLGFEVVQVEHGAAALEQAASAHGARQPFRVAILDRTVVGGLGAAEIVEDLRRASPGIRVILSTGYARDAAGHDEGAWDGALPKPYLLEALEEALTRALTG